MKLLFQQQNNFSLFSFFDSLTKTLGKKKCAMCEWAEFNLRCMAEKFEYLNKEISRMK